MLPLRDSPPPERRPILNWILVLANVGTLLWMAFGLRPSAQQEFVETWGLVPGRVRWALAHPEVFAAEPLESLRLFVAPFFTSMFLHGGVGHLLSNVWFLIIFGDNVEGRLGHARYLVFYVFCGVMAAVLHIASIPLEGVVADASGGFHVGPNPSLDAPMVGASGAIAGVLGAYVVLFPRSRVLALVPPLIFLSFEVPAWVFLGLWFVGQFLMARMAAFDSAYAVNVAYWAHVGGFVAGVVLGLFAPRRAAVRRSPFDAWRG